MVSSELRWHSEAVEDAYQARDWYAERSPLAARGFLLSLVDAIVTVTESPQRWPRTSHGCRRYVFPNQYPYTLVYRLLGEGGILIIAVAHQKRHPSYWSHR